MVWPMDSGGDPLWYLISDLVIGGLAALGTVLALLIALREYRARQAAERRAQEVEARELARLAAQEEREMRSQAQRVTSTVRPGFVDVRNGSPDPICDVQGWVRIAGGELGRTDAVPVVGGLSSVTLVVELEIEERLPDAWASVFTDSAGVRWLRVTNGTPQRLPAGIEAERAIVSGLTAAPARA